MNWGRAPTTVAILIARKMPGRRARREWRRRGDLAMLPTRGIVVRPPSHRPHVSAELLVLRLLHVLSALVWVGSGIFTTFFLFPALKPGSPALMEVMGGLQRRKLFTFLPITALVTLLSGARLLQIVSDGFSPAFFELRSGRT